MGGVVDRLADVDWAAPWLARYRRTGRRLAASLAAGADVAGALNAELAAAAGGCGVPSLSAGPLRFVAQSELPPGLAYEAFIASTASVPTRDNLHDLFNGLMWLHWPHLKRHLNELQAAEIARQPTAGRRGPVRDALTLFDENAALLRLPPLLEQALRRRNWHALFVEHRLAWADASIHLFGHALVEKLVEPRKPITAHAWLLPHQLADQDIEAFLSEWLTPERLAARCHVPLPVLGVPGWWAANDEPGFYADPAVFRPLHENGAAAIIPR
ncbi:DUF3025 domain-containing protein [Piscinibacter sakaiensis]|uniref:DUF3025 domain-containing protein n=1 Tax=Piscinibacter sakaiensis TaxID=1547922 RepID=UPI003AAB76FD